MAVTSKPIERKSPYEQFSMFYMPHRLIRSDNPLFMYQARKFKWRWDAESLKRYLIRAIVLLGLVCVGLYGLTLLDAWVRCSQSTYYCPSTYSGVIGLVLGLLVVGLVIICDFFYMAVSLNSIGPEIVSGNWDMLRLTPLGEWQIIRAKYAIVQVRAWRFMSLETAVRITCMLVLLAAIIIPESSMTMSGRNYNVFSSLWHNMRTNFVPTTAFLTDLGLIALVFILEPLWRMRVMLAMGLSISSYQRQLSFATIAAAAYWLAIRSAQGIIIFGGTLLFVRLGSEMTRFFYNQDYNYNRIDIFLSLYSVVAVGIILVALYALYSFLGRSWLQRAKNRAFRLE